MKEKNQTILKLFGHYGLSQNLILKLIIKGKPSITKHLKLIIL